MPPCWFSTMIVLLCALACWSPQTQTKVQFVFSPFFHSVLFYRDNFNGRLLVSGGPFTETTTISHCFSPCFCFSLRETNVPRGIDMSVFPFRLVWVTPFFSPLYETPPLLFRPQATRHPNPPQFGLKISSSGVPSLVSGSLFSLLVL